MKAHFLSSLVPLVEGETYPAMCGKEITDTRFLFEVEGEPESTVIFCADCFEALRLSFFATEHRLYLYAGISHKGRPSNAD